MLPKREVRRGGKGVGESWSSLMSTRWQTAKPQAAVANDGSIPPCNSRTAVMVDAGHHSFMPRVELAVLSGNTGNTAAR